MHTPDGAPCGLLNHLTQDCIIINHTPENPKAIGQALVQLGMTSINCIPLAPYHECLEVVLDGCLVGYIRKDESEEYAHKLRIMKTQEEVRLIFSFVTEMGKFIFFIHVIVTDRRFYFYDKKDI